MRHSGLLPRPRWLIPAVLFVAVLAVAMRGTRPPFASARLPDGTTIRVESVQFGTETHFVAGEWWRRLLAPLLPPGERPVPLTVHSPTPQSPVLWITEHGPLPRSWDMVAVFDEDGCESYAGEGLTAVSPIPGVHTQRGFGRFAGDYALSLGAFPRRARTVGLRFYQERTPAAQVVAELRLSNPAPCASPTWTAPEFPVPQRVGDLEVRLARFVSGAGMLNWRQPGRPEYPIESLTWIGVDILRGGQPALDWEAVTADVSDATGNVWTPLETRHREGSTSLLSGASALFREEGAYRVRVGLARRSGFPPAEQVRLPARPLAPRVFRGDVSLWDGVPVGGTQIQVGDLWPEKRRDRLHLPVEFPTESRDLWVRLVVPSPPADTVIDVQRGEGERHTLHRSEGRQSFNFVVLKPAQGRTVDLVLAVTPVRWVEFLARPRFLRR